jgi:hypothetical protein
MKPKAKSAAIGKGASGGRNPLRSNKPDPKKPAVAATNDSDRATAVATFLTIPGRHSAMALGAILGPKDEDTIHALNLKLAGQIGRARRGDLGGIDEMLVAQAHTLDAIFSSCVRQFAQIRFEHIESVEYLRAGLKAQSQCRQTWETLAAIKNPAPVAFVRQANIANGPQQVNNGTPAPSRARENETTQSKLSEGNNGLLPDSRASALAGAIDPPLETVGKIDRAQVRQREGQGG